MHRSKTQLLTSYIAIAIVSSNLVYVSRAHSLKSKLAAMSVAVAVVEAKQMRKSYYATLH